MGGYLLLNVEFRNKKDRDIFERRFKLRRIFQYVNPDSCECFYYPVFMGYAEPREMIKKSKIKFKKFLSIDLSTNSKWFNEIKQETY